MANAEHTPGPWRVERAHSKFERTIVGPSNEDIGWVNASDGLDEPAEYPLEANARLIAAAPELLEACEDCLEGRGDWGAKMSAAVAKAIGEEAGLRETDPRSCMNAAAPDMLRALKVHQLWEKREKEGPLYPFGMSRDSEGGEAVWRAWWNDQLNLCREAWDLTDAAIAKAEGR